MKGLMAAELAEISACAPTPRAVLLLVLGFFLGYIMDKITYAEIKGSTSLKSRGGHWLNDVKGSFQRWH